MQPPTDNIIKPPAHIDPAAHDDPATGPPSPVQNFTPAQQGPTAAAAPTTLAHPMITRGKAGIFKPKHRVDLSYLEPNVLIQALFATK